MMMWLITSCLVVLLCCSTTTRAFSPHGRIGSIGQHKLHVSTTTVTDDTSKNDGTIDDDAQCEVLLLDHLNINHEKGRHDALNAFYFDFLGCAIDPRKYENYVAGKKVGTL